MLGRCDFNKRKIKTQKKKKKKEIFGEIITSLLNTVTVLVFETTEFIFAFNNVNLFVDKRT